MHCFQLQDAMVLIGCVGLMQPLIFIRSIWIMCFGATKHKITRGLLELLKMTVAFYCIVIFFALSHASEFTDVKDHYPPFHVSLGMVSSIVTALRPYYILKNKVERSLKNYSIDILIGLLWVGCQYLAFQAVFKDNWKIFWVSE